MSCVTAKEFPSPLVEGMVRYLNDKHPLPGKTVVCHPVKQVRLTKKSGKVGAFIYWSDSPVIKAEICVGTSKNPATDIEQMRRIAHEYRHALQVYRDGKVYQAPLDAELEKDAWAFAVEACSGLLKEVSKYFGPNSKSVH